MTLKKISDKYMAGFLQKTLIKQVQNEDYKRFANEPRPELPKYEKPKKVPLTAGLYNFIHYNIIQLLP